jgi:aspartate carbamoyltransferase catalytic subunit
VNKGESLKDTIETVSAMGVAAFVVRHKTSGIPWQLSEWTDASIINAGDGWHQHPTQALLDSFTIISTLGRAPSSDCLKGLTIGIVGDIRHSRVARSDIDVFTRLGAKVVLVAPAAFLPSSLEGWGVTTADSLDDVIDVVDVVYMLRIQRERMDAAQMPSLREYSSLFALTPERAARMQSHALLLHPGPINRGVEMIVDPSLVPGSRILQQVTNGISIRMAVLFSLLGGDATTTLSTGAES